MKDHILNEIRRLTAEKRGKPPGQGVFEGATGVSRGEWRGKYWASWSDALVEAGFSPNKANEKLEPDRVLDCYAEACRHYKKIPTYPEWRMFLANKDNAVGVNALNNVFGGKDSAVAALRDRAIENGDVDLIKILPEKPIDSLSFSDKNLPDQSDGWVYLLGSGTHFKIGRSDNIERRVKEITVSLPEKAELVHSVRTDDTSGIENYWHNRFSDKRANGEWFKLSVQDVKAFKRRKFQ